MTTPSWSSAGSPPRFQRFQTWLSDIPDWARTGLNAGGGFTVFYGGALLEQYIQGQWKDTQVPAFAVKLLVATLLVVIFFAASQKIRTWLHKEKNLRRTREQHLEYARSAASQLISLETRTFRRQLNNGAKPVLTARALAPLTDLSTIERIVNDLYIMMVEKFTTDASNREPRVEFEVTFMTTSFNDGGITIPAFANREGRAPVSMTKRAENAKIYDKTITAELFREMVPALRIVENTDTDTHWQEVYPGQKNRIKSCVVFPVLSDLSVLMGTIVIHCDQANFFRHPDAPFWKELIGIYGRHVAVQKAKMDFAVSLGVSKPF